MILGCATHSAVSEVDEAHDNFLIVDANTPPSFYPLRNNLADEFGHADPSGFRFPFESPVLRL